MLARQEGFEPPAHGLEGRCSVQLSYWRSMIENLMYRGSIPSAINLRVHAAFAQRFARNPNALPLS